MSFKRHAHHSQTVKNKKTLIRVRFVNQNTLKMIGKLMDDYCNKLGKSLIDGKICTKRTIFSLSSTV